MMRRFSKNKFISILVYFLIVCLTFSDVSFPKFIFTEENTTQKVSRIAVLDFENLSKIKDETIVKKVTDAMILELVQCKEYEVIEREELHKIFDELKLSASGFIDPSTAKEVGKLVGVDKIVTGKVNYIEICKETKQAQIEIAVRVIEVETGKISYAAMIKGTSGEKPGYKGSDAPLIAEAISSAAKRFVAEFTGKQLPEEVAISKGKKGKKSMLNTILVVAGLGILAAMGGGGGGGGVDTGTIRVKPSIPAGAKILIDSIDTSKVTDEKNDVDIPNVKAGERTVTLRLDGYADYNKQVTVEKGGTVSVEGESGGSIVLKPKEPSGNPFTPPWKKK